MEPGIEATACACELLYVYVYVTYQLTHQATEARSLKLVEYVPGQRASAVRKQRTF